MHGSIAYVLCIETRPSLVAGIRTALVRQTAGAVCQCASQPRQCKEAISLLISADWPHGPCLAPATCFPDSSY